MSQCFRLLRVLWLDLWWALFGLKGSQSEPSLNEILQRVPWWRRGHLELALIALGNQNFELAYTSSHACLILSRTDAARLEAKGLMGKCFLGTFEFNRAVQILQEVIDYPTGQALRAKEDLAAAYIGLGDWTKAKAILEMIPEQSVSPEGKAALQYCKMKLENYSDPQK